MYEEVIATAVRSLDDASRQGVVLRSGRRLFPIPLGQKGDWSYLATGTFLSWASIKVFGLEFVFLLSK